MFFAPFLLFYAIVFLLVLAFFFILLEIHVINYAFVALGLPPELAFTALLLSLVGSYINIPIARVANGQPHPAEVVRSFGIRYRVPIRYATDSTIVAVNVGGAIVPVLISVYLLTRMPSIIAPALIGVAIVGAIVHRFAIPVPGMGIATPMLIPPIVAALCGYFLGSPNHRDAVAFISGVIGTLIGADLLNLRNLRDLGAPVASIGGAGTFDGIFLTGIVAVLLA
ncbi:MAG TPA: DUF1614 domain-containing protein [Candidatus Acidoferrum sp.]|nr:DUF1614 domain-containing protein [Candidatus Acidoferrum sp.]